MPDIKLPDGKKIPFKDKIDGFEIAKKISKSLAKEACIMEDDGQIKDISISNIGNTLVRIQLSQIIDERNF